MKKIIEWVKANPFITIIALIVLSGLLYLILGSKDKTLAGCLKSKGAKFYGAYWCPHCKHQKSLFANPKNLPYIECIGSDNKEIKECKDAGVSSYPTWVFADGNKISGELTISQLNKISGC